MVGFLTFTLPLIAYSTYVNSIPILDVHTANQLEAIAYVVVALTLAGLALYSIWS